MRSVSSVVDHPPHYGGDSTYETIKVLEAWLTPTEYIGFLKGNAIKYLSRHRMKGGLEDLDKADWYQRRMLEYVKSHGFDGKTETLSAADQQLNVAIVSMRTPTGKKVPDPLGTADRREIAKAAREVLANDAKAMNALDARGRRIGNRAKGKRKRKPLRKQI